MPVARVELIHPIQIGGSMRSSLGGEDVLVNVESFEGVEGVMALHKARKELRFVPMANIRYLIPAPAAATPQVEKKRP